jgi:multiple sugar transport system ATP-binding protein
MPIGDVRLPDDLLGRLQPRPGAGRMVIVGIRPEHLEDARLIAHPSRGHTFMAKIDLLEALGSEYYAHAKIDAERISSTELDELAAESGTADLSRVRDGVRFVARLAPTSRIERGKEAELWLDTSQLQLFDRDGGRNLLAREARPAALSMPARAAG